MIKGLNGAQWMTIKHPDPIANIELGPKLPFPSLKCRLCFTHLGFWFCFSQLVSFGSLEKENWKGQEVSFESSKQIIGSHFVK